MWRRAAQPTTSPTHGAAALVQTPQSSCRAPSLHAAVRRPRRRPSTRTTSRPRPTAPQGWSRAVSFAIANTYRQDGAPLPHRVDTCRLRLPKGALGDQALYRPRPLTRHLTAACDPLGATSPNRRVAAAVRRRHASLARRDRPCSTRGASRMRVRAQGRSLPAGPAPSAALRPRLRRCTGVWRTPQALRRPAPRSVRAGTARARRRSHDNVRAARAWRW